MHSGTELSSAQKKMTAANAPAFPSINNLILHSLNQCDFYLLALKESLHYIDVGFTSTMQNNPDRSEKGVHHENIKDTLVLVSAAGASATGTLKLAALRTNVGLGGTSGLPWGTKVLYGLAGVALSSQKDSIRACRGLQSELIES